MAPREVAYIASELNVNLLVFIGSLYDCIADHPCGVIFFKLMAQRQTLSPIIPVTNEMHYNNFDMKSRMSRTTPPGQHATYLGEILRNSSVKINRGHARSPALPTIDVVHLFDVGSAAA